MNISYNTSDTSSCRWALRSLFLIAIFIVVAASSLAQDVRGQKSFGVKGGYVSANHSPMAGLVLQYSFSQNVRIAPQMGIVFRNRDKDALIINLDMHFPIPFAAGHAAIYPIVGLAFDSWTLRSSLDEDKDVNTRANRFGANAGLGFDIRCASSLKISIEGRYTFAKDFSHALVSAGIAYIF